MWHFPLSSFGVASEAVVAEPAKQLLPDASRILTIMHRARRTVSEPHALWAMTGRSHLASAAGTPRVRTGSCSVLTVRALVAAAFLRRRLLAAVLLAALVLLLLHLRPVQHAALERVVLLGASLPVVPDADARWVTHFPTSRISASSAPRRLAGLRICVVAISPSTSEPAPRPDGLVSAVALALLAVSLVVALPPLQILTWAELALRLCAASFAGHVRDLPPQGLPSEQPWVYCATRRVSRVSWELAFPPQLTRLPQPLARLERQQSGPFLFLPFFI